MALNAWETVFTLTYIRDLNKKGELGPGKAIDSPLDFSDYGTLPFVQRFLQMMATKRWMEKSTCLPRPCPKELTELRGSGAGSKPTSRAAIYRTRIGAFPCTTIQGRNWNGVTEPFSVTGM